LDDDGDIDGSNSTTKGEADNAETTGRWTREEHLLFIKGLEMFGKGWKKIAGLIQTRTVVQIRTHAQKYFLKLTKARQQNSTSEPSATTDQRVSIMGAKKVSRQWGVMNMR
jgi:SHAQKYF class myb-like DNA-binding protein